MRTQKYQLGIISFLLACLISLTSLPLISQASSEVVDVYFFYSQTCPHCFQQKLLMNYLDEHNEDVDIHAFEVTEHPQEWQDFREKYQLNSTAVPRTLIGEKIFIGYSESQGDLEYNSVYQGYIGYKNQLIKAIEAELGRKPHFPVEQNRKINRWLVFVLPGIYLLTYPFATKKFKQQTTAKRYWLGGLSAITIFSLFWFIFLTPDALIQDFAQQLPFPLFVFIIALVDGFNPCAFTVLIILLSLLTYTKSRKDMTIFGSTFITTSAIMYFLFIMVMVLVGSIFLAKYGGLFLLVLGLIITIAGVINLKDYFWFKQGFSLSLSPQQQLTVSQKAGAIVKDIRNAQPNQQMFWSAIVGTILLATFVNLIELGCTAILPAVYMTTLVNYCAQNNYLCYVFWTALYATIYIIPLFAILLNFIYSFKSTRITEQQSRNLKLLSGLFMLFFGLIMLFKPELLLVG